VIFGLDDENLFYLLFTIYPGSTTGKNPPTKLKKKTPVENESPYILLPNGELAVRSED